MSIGLGVNASTPAGLTPPEASAASLSLSPGASSDLSNEAAAGHSFNAGIGASAPGVSSSSMAANGGPLFASLRSSPPLAGSPAHSSAFGTPAAPNSPSTRFVGGFDVPQDASIDSHPTPTDQTPQTSNASTANPNALSASISSGTEHGSNGNPAFNTAASGPSTSTSYSVNAASPFTNATAPAMALDEVIPTTFDESTLRALCDMDVSMCRPEVKVLRNLTDGEWCLIDSAECPCFMIG